MKTAISLFLVAVLGGWISTEGASPTAPERRVFDLDPAASVGDDHGHANPVLDLDVDVMAVRPDALGREQIDYEVTVKANARDEISYSYRAVIEDDKGQVVAQLGPGAQWSLAPQRGAAHSVALPAVKDAGFYKAHITARTGRGIEAVRSVFFEISRGGSAIPMDRSEWLLHSEATRGTAEPSFSAATKRK